MMVEHNTTKTRVLRLVRADLSDAKIAAKLGITRGVVRGYRRRAGIAPEPQYRPAIYDRMDALDAKMNAVLAATVGVGRIKWD